jgi:molybdate transport system substrate-binding protein
MQRFLIFLVLLFLSTLPVTAKETVYIYAASSMTDVVKSLESQFKKSHIEIKGVFGSSSSLARQVSQGAPADIFISANTQWMNYIEQQLELGVAPSVVIAHNQLVVISQNSEVSISNLLDGEEWKTVLGNNRLAMGDPRNVPVGIYAKQALENLGVWPNLATQIAPMKNSRSVLAMVERGQSPLGLVYATDALQSSRVQQLATIPLDLHSLIEYPAIQLTNTEHTAEVFRYLTGPRMQDELTRLGFISVSLSKDKEE